MPVLQSRDDETAKSGEEADDTKATAPRTDKKDETSELPGGLAEIIRDLTRRPST